MLWPLTNKCVIAGYPLSFLFFSSSHLLPSPLLCPCLLSIAVTQIRGDIYSRLMFPSPLLIRFVRSIQSREDLSALLSSLVDSRRVAPHSSDPRSTLCTRFQQYTIDFDFDFDFDYYYFILFFNKITIAPRRWDSNSKK